MKHLKTGVKFLVFTIVFIAYLLFFILLSPFIAGYIAYLEYYQDERILVEIDRE